MIKKNLPLYIALALPVIIIVAIALAIYIPGRNFSPSHNFLYVTGQGVSYSGEFSVSGGHVQDNLQNPLNGFPPPMKTGPMQFYVYDVVKKQASEVTFAQAQKLQLDIGPTSSDGYEVTNGNSGGGFFFFGANSSDYYNHYIRGHNRSEQLNLKLSGTPTYDNFQFLGWIQ